ncbi:MAG: cupin domain-containing protein [Oscillospiraceae bacterium]|nr:cupin domain-containing protein [Oscillospiraceae bacterium]
MNTVRKNQAELMKLPQRDVWCFIGTEKMDTPVKSDHITMGMTEVPARVDMIPHTHETEEEIVFIIEGTGEVTVGGVTEPLEPFTAVKFPVGVEHQVRNTGGGVMKFVFMFNPAFSFGR